MVELARDIESLSNFKRETARFVQRLKQTGQPVVLTINGKAELVVQDAASYQRLLNLAERVESLESLRASLDDADAGRTRPLRKAVKSLGRAEMKYAVEITDTAWAEVEEAYDWLADRAPQAAQKWKAGLLDCITRLETMPMVCSLAPEAEYFGREVRQLLYGKRQHKYRILFEIRDRTVIVLRVRHGAQRLLGEE